MRVLLVAYDNDSYIHFFPLGLAYVASALRNEGHDVEVYQQDIYHYPESHLGQYLNEEHFDAVGLGMCAGYYQYDKFKKIISVVPPNVEIWLGGQMFTPEPEYFSQFSNYICQGEYDYNRNVDEIAYPAWDLFSIDYYSLILAPHREARDRCFPILSGRGCPFRCNFCYRMIKGYRPRSVGSIVEEIELLKDRYRINYFLFSDELLMINPDRTIEIAEALKLLDIKWNCNGRLNYAYPKVLRAMKEAGCVFINYGIESLDDGMLEVMNKNLTTDQIIKGIEATLAEGISPGFNIIFGNIGETLEILQKGVDFLLKYDDHSQLRTIRPVTPYPGCDLYYYAIKKGLLKDCADFYENKHINSDLLSVNFTNLSDGEFHRALFEANKTLLENYYKHQLKESLDISRKLYLEKDASFRGFRQT